MSVQSRSAFGVLVVAGMCVNAQAGISQSTLVPPGGFVQAGATPSASGSIGWPGDDLSPFPVNAGAQFSEGSFPGLGVVSRSAIGSAPNYSGNCSGTVGMGYALLSAFNNAPNSAQGPFATANGGWKETFTITHPSHNGQSGTLQFTVDVSAFLRVTGFAGSASIRVVPYKNNALVLMNSFFSPGNSVPFGTDRQYGNWSIASFGNTDTLPVNGTATFGIPFTFGTPFTVGVYGWARGSMRSQSGVAGNSTGLVENGVIRWGGILGVFAGSTPVTAGSTVIGASGKDWGPATQPPDPCPGDFNLDGQVDDADFVIFVNSYNILDCADPSMPEGCPGDMNGDGFVDDADFVDFAFAYNNLVCI
ncbi:MAG: hypothetical protein JNK16_11510 [Phycisphaerales bacterium]|nr:hypothetical protein [Phycisphaerales bacterium]